MKYLRLYWQFLKTSFVADLEFRSNFITRILTDIFWYLGQIVTFEVLFRHTQQIGSWNIEQMRVFLGILFVVDALYMILFSENIGRMSDRVVKGELDLLLAKPISSQFLISCQRLNTAIFGNLVMASVWLIWSLNGLGAFSWSRLLWLLPLIPAGLACLYSIRFMFGTMAILLTKADNLDYLWYQLYKLGMRPDTIYSPWLKFLLLSVLPVAVIASVPARALVENPSISLFLWAIAIASLFVYLSHKLWLRALRSYASASS
jgi:ABC-2 type transport system permease protein